MRSPDRPAARWAGKLVLVVVLAAGGLAAGCSSQSTAAPSAGAATSAAAVSSSAGPAQSSPAQSSPAQSSSVSADGGLVGTWVTGKTTSSPTQPYVTFAEGGTWTSSDGCNRVQGTWQTSDAKTLVITSGPMTMMACEGAPIPAAVSAAHTFTVAADQLTLYDKSGKQLVVLVAGSAPESSAAPSSA